MPLLSGRGQCSTKPLFDLAKRYRASGKHKLIVLSLSDLDPDGDAITHSLGQRLRDDHGIKPVQKFKVALTIEQVTEFGLIDSYQPVKKESKNYPRYYDSTTGVGPPYHSRPNAVANAIGYAEHRSRSHDAVIRVYNAAGKMIEAHEHKGDFKEW